MAKDLKSCTATITFKKDMGSGNIKQFTHQCCLFAPHKGYKHYTPTLLITCGGERITHDIHGKDIAKTWSPFQEKIA